MENEIQKPQNSLYKPVTVGDWIVTLLLMAIPIVNLILLFVWAFGSNTPISKANWAKATLIWMAIVFAIYILIFLVAGAGILAALNM
ncbi:MAG TPA: hypothetical protein ENN07_06760 [candidate division Zixibacteria bacterium]|nr:hypothetical protein [candidate division Zixibacteria bacterium]